jgi:hypothetical protein
MWMLFVLNLSYEGERKVAFYDSYQTELQCRIEALLLTEEFDQAEESFCVQKD